MAEEFEVKVLSIDLEAIRDRLRAIGRLDRQATIHDIFYETESTKSRDVDVRLRSTETSCTLTVKGPYTGECGRKSREEVELALPSVEVGQALVRLEGFVEKSRRTLDRDYYLVGAVSVEIIFSEKFPPYLEVEGVHDGVIAVCGMLGIAESELSVGGQPYVHPDSR